MKSKNKIFPDANKIINKLKLYYHLKSDASLAALLDIRPNTLAIWKVRNSVDLQRIIEQCPSLDLNWLIDDNKVALPDNALMPSRNTSMPKAFAKYESHAPVNERNQVYIVNKGMLKEYPAHCQARDYIMRLERFKQPASFGWEGIVRMFQFDSPRMEPVISSSAWIIGIYMQKPWLADLGRLYIAITAKDAYWGRLQDPITGLEDIKLSADNTVYPNNIVAPKDLKELWMVQTCMAESLNQYPKMIESRVQKLEENLNKLNLK
jgi:hypothetical protein